VATIPKKVSDRLIEGIKKYQPIVESAKTRDIGEADTVILVTELLSELFGYDKFTEITSELAVKAKWCDLATKIEDKLQTLIEVKKIGYELRESHADQVVGYSSTSPIEWALLTNGQHWRAYYVRNNKPLEPELVVEIDFLKLSHKSEDDLAQLYLFCKEGWIKSVIGEYQAKREALSRFFIGAVILSEPVLAVIRRELKHVSPEVKFDIDDIKAMIENEVIKRDVLEGEKAEVARKKVARLGS
jgi:predicted type IV restriction endonuclease